MAEQRLGVVAGASMAGPLGPKEFGLMLTDRRSIFVLEKVNRAVIGAAMGGVVGGLIAGALSTRKDVDYVGTEVDNLAGRKGSICVEHTAVRTMRIKKKLLDDVYNLRIEYAADGKLRKLQASIIPSSQNVLPGGMKRKDALRLLALSVQDSYQSVLPTAIVARGDWIPPF